MHNNRKHTSNNLRILYYNARSLLPKFDELLISADSHQPDVICITESWLCSDIQDSEILIVGYQLLRHDRNRSGGGVLMYVAQHLVVKQLPSHPCLELLTVTLHYNNHRKCLSLFYRPPSSSAVEILSSLHSYLELINIPQFTTYILIGDFNINFYNRIHPSLSNILSTFGLTQVVNDYTHIHKGNCFSLIDLVLMSTPSSLSSCRVIPPLANSDHLGIEVNIKLKESNKSVRHSSRVIWQYSHADWDEACKQIETFDWDSIVSGDINSFWISWHS